MAINLGNSSSRGTRLPYTNTGSAIAAGDLVILNSGTTGLVGVALTDIAATSGTGEVAIGGGDERIFPTTNKATGEAWTIGQPLFSDGTNITSTSSTTFNRVGRAAAAAASADTTGSIILNG